MPRRWAHRPSTTSRFTNVGQPPHGGPAIGAPVATLGFAGRFTGWLDGQPASVRRTPNHCVVRSRASLPSAWPARSELEITVTLPGPEATHRWRGRTLVDHHGEPLGSIEIIYLDKVTNQPEWALLEAGATGPAPTFVPLVSANEEGDTVRVPFAKALVERAPSMPADRELSEEQERELYRHYGVPYSRADSPSGLPAGEPGPPNRPWRLAATQPRRSQCPPAHLIWRLPGSPRCLLRNQRRPPTSRCRPAAMPCLRRRPPNRRRSPPPLLLRQYPGRSMSQSPRRLRPAMAWWREGSCESPTRGSLLAPPRLPLRLGSGGGRRSVGR